MFYISKYDLSNVIEIWQYFITFTIIMCSVIIFIYYSQSMICK